MSDILGPADATNSVTVRPADERNFLTADTWFRDCSDETSDDGTDVNAAWLNGTVAALRALWRMNGKLEIDNITPVVAEFGNDDNGIVKSIQHLIQRGQMIYAEDVGTVNSVVAALNPPLAEYKKGLTVNIKIKETNTGGAVVNLNALGTKKILRPDGNILLDSDLPAGAVMTLRYDGVNFQAVGVDSRPVLRRNTDLYVNAAFGNDAFDGTVNDAQHALATVQKAIDIAFSYSPSQYAITIHVADGTYQGFLTPQHAGPNVIIVGNTGNASAVTITNAIAGKHCVQVQGPNTMSVSYLRVVNTGGLGGGGFVASGNANLNTSNTVSAGISTGAVFEAYGNANVNINGPHSFTGNCFFGVWGMLGGMVSIASNIALTIANPIVVSSAFFNAAMGGRISFGPPNASFVNPGNVTGTKYSASSTGVINTNGAGASFIPGSVAGSVSGGGVYI